MKSILLVLLCVCFTYSQYLPTWDSLDTRPLPQWYDDAKFGIFIHWGVFSVPSFHSEWFWDYWQEKQLPDVVDFMKKNYPPDFTYADFASQFHAEFYNPDHWADIFQAAGAKYVVLTSKHHEGFCNWPTKHSFSWNAMEVGPKRDLVGDLANSIRNRTNIKFGLYHSLFEWFNPVHQQDAANGYKTQDFVRYKSMPELFELVLNYKPEIVWSDGDSGPDYYWNSTEFIAWLYNESPVKDTVVTNDRWGSNGVMCHHGDFYTCDDRYNPGKLQNHKWENCMTIDGASWGYRRNAQLSDYLSTQDLISSLVSTVSCGGNLLLNVGPTKEGIIIPIFEERLRQMGEWLSVNGEAIYETRPWLFQNDTINENVWYTAKPNAAYAILLKWPSDVIQLGAPIVTAKTTVEMLGYSQTINWSKNPGGGISINVDQFRAFDLPSSWAWTFKLTNLGNKKFKKLN